MLLAQIIYILTVMTDIQKKCIELRDAYANGLLGDQTMPEDTHPVFKTTEQKLSYFTLPMSLNYQRNSYTLWESAKKTCNDHETCSVFDVVGVAQMGRRRTLGQP